MTRLRCSLSTPEGASRRVDALGILIGRQADCDIVVDDAAVSRRHALVRLDSEGAEVVPLGKTPILHNGKPCDRRQPLGNGDILKIGTLELSVAIDEVAAATPPPCVVLVRGTSYGVTKSPFVIGGAATDHVILDGWPASAIAIHAAGNELFVEVAIEGATKNGVALARDEPTPLAIGDVLTFDNTPLAIGRGALDAHTTQLGDSALPTKVVVEMLPRGGRVMFTLATGDHCVYLADKRLDLIAALLQPPSGFAAGEFIPDDVLRPLVWPGNIGVTRSEINVHITRCRKDLIAAGLPGPRLIQRAPTGGATRLALAPKCEVVILT